MTVMNKIIQIRNRNNSKIILRQLKKIRRKYLLIKRVSGEKKRGLFSET